MERETKQQRELLFQQTQQIQKQEKNLNNYQMSDRIHNLKIEQYEAELNQLRENNENIQLSGDEKLKEKLVKISQLEKDLSLAKYSEESQDKTQNQMEQQMKFLCQSLEEKESAIIFIEESHQSRYEALNQILEEYRVDNVSLK